MKKQIKRVVQYAPLLLLCACATKSPVSPANSSAQSTNTLNAAPSNPEAAAKSLFNEKQVIAPNESIEKNGLQVSYTMKSMRGAEGYLVQLSLVFRNMKKQSVNVRPKVTLLNGVQHPVKAFTKSGFLKYSTGVSGNRSTAGVSPSNKAAADQGAGQARAAWANSYWLKDRFTISPEGIEIGGLVYHCAGIELPMTLVVKSAQQQYEFVIKDPLPVADERQGSPAR